MKHDRSRTTHVCDLLAPDPVPLFVMGRIEAVAEMSDTTLRVLDLKEELTRKAVFDATDAENLYLSNAATNY